MRRRHHQRYQGLFTRLASFARSLASPASAGLLLAVAAWLAVLGVIALPATAQAGVLVSNLGQSVTHSFILTEDFLRAQAFSIPSGDEQYTLASIEISFGNNANIPPFYAPASNIDLLTVGVWSADSSGHPANSLYTLTNPTRITPSTTATFTAPEGATLEAGNTYVVYMHYDHAPLYGFGPGMLGTTVTAEDSDSHTGWTIADTSLWRDPTDTSWSEAPFGYSFLFRLNGSVVGIPDVTGTAVTSSADANSSYETGDVIQVTVTFSEAVSVDTMGGTPRLALTIGSSTRYADYSASGSTATALLFAYPVTANDHDKDGISIDANALQLNGGAIHKEGDTSTNAVLHHRALSTQAGHRVNRGPFLVSGGVSVLSSPQTASDTYGADETFELEVAFSEPVNATTNTDFVLRVGRHWRRAPLLRGSGTDKLVFGYTVQPEDRAPSGITGGNSDQTLVGDRNGNPQNGAITSVANGRAADLTHGSLGAWDGHKADGKLEPRPPNTAAPVITTTSPVETPESTTAVTTLEATDVDNDLLSWLKTGGADADRFILTAAGRLRFAVYPFASFAPPNYEDPADVASADPANDAQNNEYVVFVTVSDGTHDTKLKLVVRVTDVDEQPEKPAKPAVAAKAGTADSLEVSWTKPDLNGGPDITGYDVQYREGASGDWENFTHSGTAVTTTITGLTADTEYQVQVRAKNDELDSDWSDPSDAVKTNVETTTPSCTLNTGDLWCGVMTVGEFHLGPSGGTGRGYRFGQTGSLPDDEFPYDGDTPYRVQAVYYVSAASSSSLPAGTLALTINRGIPDGLTLQLGNEQFPTSHATSQSGTSIFWSGSGLNWSVGDHVTLRLRGEAPPTPAVTLVLSADSIGENGGVSTVTATVSPASAAAFTVTVAAAAVPPAVAADFRLSANQVLSFAENATESTGSVTITGVDNDVDAVDKTVTVSGTVSASSVTAPPTRTLTLEDDDATNTLPTFTSSATFDAAENQTTAGTVVATDGDTEDEIEGYAIVGGADQGQFSIHSTSGALTFKAAPNFEDPDDANTDGRYQVTVQATSGTGTREKTATQTITVTVTDDDTEKPGKPNAPTVSAASVTSLTVTWSAPANAGPAVTDYDYRHRTTSPEGNWTEVTDTTSTALSATIGSLAENTSYDVQVRATNAEGTGDWSDSGTGTTDANAAPSFTSDAEFDAAENQTSAGTVVATDGDSEDEIEGYAITGGADQAFFSIGATSGALTFQSAPNFEDPDDANTDGRYQVTVQATSGTDTREKTATQAITVTVTDDDTEKPAAPAAPNVEAASVSSLTVTWAAPANAGPAIADYDVQYRAGTTGDWSDGNHTGAALTATLSSLSENTSYQVQVRATNAEGTGSWSASGSGTTDANAAPSFSSSATFDAAENQTSAGTVVATDGDTEDNVTGYALTGGADQEFFSIHSTSGALTFKAAPNFEDPDDANTDGRYQVTVQATSGTGTREKTATQTITVTVTDDDTEKPAAPAAPNVEAASVSSLTVTWAAPANAGPAIADYDLQYRAGTTGDWSDGGHTGAALTATLSSLSENTSYQVQVRATNAEGTGSWSASGSGSTDANAAPAFSSSATFDAAENQTSAGTVLATDGDTGDDITGYAITGGADQAFFSIGATSGALTFDAAPNFEDAQDADTDNEYEVTVQATSGTGERVKTATQTITVTVTDDDTEKPAAPAAPNVEAASVSSLTVTWAAPANAGPAITDYDVQYREGTSGSWSDGGHTGAATTATLTGLSENTSYQVQVRATNAEGTGSWSDSGSGTTDANAAPAFSSSATFDAAENQTSAGTVLATDGDTEDEIEGYAITGGADQGQFSIGATSGALTFKVAPNFEDAKDQGTNNTYEVTVQATSGTDTRVKTATQTITVTVTDVAGEAPGKPDAPDVAAASVSSLTVNWSAPANAGPEITDYDVQYREGTSGDWTDGNHTGAATTATLSGLSENTSYQVQVRATNDEGTGSWSDSGSGSTDANAAPSFSSSATFDAAENQTAAGTVLATDGDTEDDVTGYAITGGADQGQFSIGATSGALTFKVAPNFEDAKDQGTDNTYVVTVQATSGTGEREKTATQTITVTVTDVAGEAPGKPDAPDVSAASVSSLTVIWAAPANAGPAITDYDVQYRAGTTGDWSDGGHTGAATTATLSGLSENTAYQVQVRATNAEGTGSWSASGSGATDANAAPSFTSSATFDAAENQIAAGTVLATDGDAGDDVTGYAITGGADQTFFSIGATSGALTFDAAPNFEDAKDQGTNNTYEVTVQATSGTDTRVKTATQTITVTVTDDDTEKPAAPAAPNVSAASVTSLTVTWTAPANAGPAIDDYDVRYREGTTGDWSDGNHVGAATTATLTGLSENTSYQVQVRATNDEGTGSWSDSGSGTTDANAAPAFSSSATFDAAENQTAAGTVVAADSDTEDEIEGYAITGGADQGKFSIHSTSGALTFKAAPNFEDPDDANTDGRYQVTVQATSGTGTREKTATQTITVTVTDVAGEAPGKPDAPDVAAASVTSLTVSWSAPANAGPAITDYDVQYREGTSGNWTDGGHTGAATTATLSSLSENTSHQVQVRATNAEGTGDWSDSGTGTTDANAAPTFSSSATFDAAENQTSAGTVVATDGDSDDDITGYAITGGADQGKFSIHSTSGALTFDAAPNFEDPDDANTDGRYQVTVEATSGTGTRVKTATQTITVTVTDVDEAGSVSLFPALLQVRTVVRTTLSDPDGVRSLAWQWAKSADKSNWVPISGATRADYMPVDGDLGMYLRAVTTYTDGEGSGKTAEGVADNVVGTREPAPELSVKVLVSGRFKPWGIAFVPDGTMLFTQREGKLSSRLADGTVQRVTADFSDLSRIGNNGLMGIVVDPSFATATNRRFYTCQGHTGPEVQVIAWTIDAAYTTATRVSDPLVEGIASGGNHNGCRLRFGPDGYLYITTGDTETTGTVPQDLAALGGKVLRVDPATGAAPMDNPISGSIVYTYGHRNIQGLALRPGTRQMWSVEHGPTVDDEINLLVAGANYGWDPAVTDANGDPLPGYDDTVPMTDLREFPDAKVAKWSSGDPTLATAGGIFLDGEQWGAWEGRLAVATLKNKSLHIFEFTEDGNFASHVIPPELDHTHGRLRTPMLGPDGALYIATDPVVILRVTLQQAPEFAAAMETRQVPENTAGTAVVATVEATDYNHDPLTYTLGGTDVESFYILDENIGELRVPSTTQLDYETKQTYEVTVTATDDQNTSDTVTLTIEVTDVEHEGKVILPLTQPRVGSPFEATLSDPDGGVTAVTWKWERSDTAGTAWEDINGAAAASYTPVSDDVGRYLRATVTYTNTHGPGKTAQSVTSSAVGAAPNSNPEFPSASLVRRVAEHTAAGQPIDSPVEADDADGDPLQYALSGMDADLFDINSSTEQLLTKAALDYEAENEYSVIVSVSDGKDANGDPDTAVDDSVTVTIQVINVDEAGTVSLFPAQLKVRTVVRATLSDPDGDVHSVSWRWFESSDRISWASIASAAQADYMPTVSVRGQYLRATARYDDGEGSGKTAEEESDHVVGEREPAPRLTVVPLISDLSIPWGIAFTPDGTMLLTERGGTLSSRLPNGTVQPVTADFSDLQVSGQTGLMGIAVAPSFATNRQFYTCQGHTGPEGQVIRWTIDAAYTTATRIGDPFVVGLPFGSQNGGCRLRFGPNGYLWIATGDAGVGTTPQDLSSLGGKFLKVDASTGAGAPGNPFGSRVYTYGHRNPQGLALRPGTSQMWSVEHGPTVDDEINLLVAGANYGWDPVPGYNESVPMTDLDKFPDAFEARWSSGNSTLATSGGIFLEGDDWDEWEGRLAVATLKNQSLRIFEFTADGTFVSHVVVPELDGTYGRLRTPMIGPDGALYVTTSNGSPGEDLILKVAPSLPPAFPAVTSTQAVAENSPLLTVVATVTAIDPDGEALSYALGGPDAAFFTIPNSAAGQVRARTTLDYETRSSYAVIVTATDPYGLSDSIPVDITVTNEQERPGAPEAPTFSGETAESMTVNWSEPENSGPPISDYDVQYWEKGAGRFTDAQHEGPGLSLTLADLEAGTVYEVRVRATNDEGTGDWSESGEGRTVAPLTVGMTIDLPPPVEGAFTVRFSFSEVVRSFTRGDIDTRQEPDCRDSGSNPVSCNPDFTALQSTDNRIFTTTVTPRTERVAHNYTLTITVGANTVISTLDSKPNEAATLEVRVAPPGVEEPISSIGLGASSGSGSVRLSWNRPSDDGGSAIIRYEVRYQAVGEAWSEWENVGARSLGVTVGGLVNGREYIFEVRAVNALGKGGAETVRAVPERRIAPPPPPPPPPPPGGGGLLFPPEAPAGLMAMAGEGAVRLEWSPPESDGGTPILRYEYRLKEGRGEFGEWTPIEDSAPGEVNATGYTVGELGNGTVYVFELRAVNLVGEGRESEAVEVVMGLDGAYWSNFGAEDLQGSEAGLEHTPFGGTPRSVRLRFGADLRFEESELEGEGEVTGTRSGSYGYRYTSRTTGELSLDYDRGASCELRLTFRGEGAGNYSYRCGGRLGGQGSFRLSGLNRAPEITSAGVFEVMENRTRVGRLEAVDPDEGDGIEGYGIAGGADASLFVIEAETGELLFREAPDYETPGDVESAEPASGAGDNEYIVVVEVSSGEGERERRGSRAIRVRVSDEEEPPEITSIGPFEVVENRTMVGRLEAVDQDKQDEIREYGIAGGADGGLFAVAEETGELLFREAPDYEDPGDVESAEPASGAGDNEYIVVVEVSSGEGERERRGSRAIRVRVADEEEPPGAPAAPAVTAEGSHSLKVRWREPENRGPAIVDYEVRYREAGEAGYSDGGHQGRGLMVRLSGLKEGTVYEVQVRAVNEEGMSEWSEPGEGRTDREEADPDDPSDFSGKELEGRRLTLRQADADGTTRSLELRFGEGNRFEQIESGGQEAATRSEGASRSGSYSYEKTGPGRGRLRLAYDDGSFCEIRLSFAGTGVGGFVYDCGGGAPAEGSFRLTTGSLFVPVILSAAGQNQSLFTSELTLTNRGEREARLHYTYTAHFGGGSGRASDVLAPGRQKIETDALVYLRSLGIAIPETGNRIGTLRVEVRLGSEVEAVVRTTTAVVEGRAGLAYPGVGEEEGFQVPVYLCGLRQNGKDRSNLAFQNMGAPEEGAITLRTTVYSGKAGDTSARVLEDVKLETGGFHQYSGLLGVLGVPAQGYVKVERVEGRAPFYAYGVINDQANSDGSFVFPVTASWLEGRRGQTLPVVVETSEFRSELTVTNFSDEARTLQFSFVADGVRTPDHRADYTLMPMRLEAGEQRIIPDIVAALRQQGVEGIGPSRGFYTGAVFATAVEGDMSGIVIGARTGSEGGGGQYSVFYNAVPVGAAFSEVAWIDALQQNGENRSNLALVNTGEVDDSDSVFSLEIYDGETGLLVTTIATRPIPARGWHQINGILGSYAPETRQGYVRILKVSGENPFLAYGVVNDGGAPGERSGDGAYVPARE